MQRMLSARFVVMQGERRVFVSVQDGKIMNVFHCFDCGTGHNMLTLYAELCHLTGKDRYKKAYREIYKRKQEEPGRKKDKESDAGR